MTIHFGSTNRTMLEGRRVGQKRI